MKCTFIVNGSCKLNIQPENELEKLMLQELCREEIMVSKTDKVFILDKNILDSITISPKPIDKNETNKEQS